MYSYTYYIDYMFLPTGGKETVIISKSWVMMGNRSFSLFRYRGEIMENGLYQGYVFV